MKMPGKRVSEIEDRWTEIIQSKQRREKRTRKKMNKVSGTWDTNKSSKIHVPKGQE